MRNIFSNQGLPSIACKLQTPVMNNRCEFTISEADYRPISAVFQTVLNRKKLKKAYNFKDTF